MKLWALAIAVVGATAACSASDDGGTAAGGAGGFATGGVGTGATGGSAGTLGTGGSAGAASGGTGVGATGGTGVGATGGTGAGATGGAAGAGGSGGGFPLGLPITAPPLKWTWVDFPAAKCRDGSATGIGVNLNPLSTKVMIYLQGGGACFNSETCAKNPSHFDATNFSSLSGGGIGDRTNLQNPVRDWNMVFVPYCTGDIHAGNNSTHPGGNGVPPNQKFVGHANMTKYLGRIVPTIANATQVLLTGESAGGFGSLLNYLQTQKAFGSTPVTVIDDSGPLLAEPWVPACMQSWFRQLWNLDATILAECGGACPSQGAFMESYVTFAAAQHPSNELALISSVGDDVISWFLGFGTQGCTGSTPLTPTQYQAGIEDFRDRIVKPFPSFGTYYLPGTAHTFITSGGFFTIQVSGTKLVDWVASEIAGTTSHVQP